MEALPQSVWNFMQGAYREGLLDDLLDMVNDLSGPEVDLGDLLGELEEFLGAVDFTPMENLAQTNMEPLLTALSDQRALAGLHEAVKAMGPALPIILAKTGGDIGSLKVMAEAVGKSLKALPPVMEAILPTLLITYRPQLLKFMEEKGGALLAAGLNAGTAAVNNNPRVAARVISDFIAGVDTVSLHRAADRLLEGFTDRLLPIVKAVAIVFIKQIRKRLWAFKGA